MTTLPRRWTLDGRRLPTLIPGALVLTTALVPACTPDQVTAPLGPTVAPALLSNHQAPIEWVEQFVRVSTIPGSGETSALDGVKPGIEPGWSLPLASLENFLAGPIVYVGDGCDESDFQGFPQPVPGEAGIAVMAAGGCTFEEKVTLAEEAGAGGAVIHNTTALGLGGDPEALIVMPGTGSVGIPAVFGSASTGLALAGAAPGNILLITPPRKYLRVTSNAFPGDQYRALEGSFGPFIASRPGQLLSGDVVDVGLGCNASPYPPDLQGKVALIERGSCPFVEKILRAEANGAVGVVIFATAAEPDSLVIMGDSNAPEFTIPSVFMARSPALLIRNSSQTPVTITIAVPGATTPEIVEQVEDVINQLEEDGVLNGGQANSLRSQLEAAKRQISRGNLSAARNILNAFIQHVQGMMAQGTLSAADGALLIALAQSLLASL